MTGIQIGALTGLLALPVVSRAQPRSAAQMQVTTLVGSAGDKNKVAVDGASTSVRFRWPMGIVVDEDGVVYVSDEESNIIRKITPTGIVSTLAGTTDVKGSTDGAAATTRFYHPGSMPLARYT